MKNKHYITTFVVIMILVIFSNFLFYQKSFAIQGFGGKILLITPCANGVLLTLGPPTPGLFLLTPATRMYPHYAIKEEVTVLGAITPFGMCSLGLSQIPVVGTIIMMGTTLPKN